MKPWPVGYVKTDFDCHDLGALNGMATVYRNRNSMTVADFLSFASDLRYLRTKHCDHKILCGLGVRVCVDFPAF
jgi:hypothetical protein